VFGVKTFCEFTRTTTGLEAPGHETVPWFKWEVWKLMSLA
jgi:hypothetical protein